jgi:predicted metal-dependent hydrolase
MSDLSVFGKLTWVKSPRARHISVKILADGLRITIPGRYSESDALRFVLNEKEKILLKQKRLKARAQKTMLQEDGELQTATFTVSFQRVKRKDVFFSLKQGRLLVDIPEGEDFEDEKVQQACWNGINYFLKKEAKRVLPERVRELAQQFGFRYEDVKIQSSKTRWGSCSHKKSINLSFYLMLVPANLADYVILHELCHTKEMNHGDKFWALMDKVTDNKAYYLRQALKKYHLPDY